MSSPPRRPRAPANAKLKSSTEYSKIGQPRVRIDTPSKVDGSAQFGVDMRLPNMLYGALAHDAAPGDIGEASTAMVAPAVCNAIYAATGRRLRSLPISRHGLA